MKYIPGEMTFRKTLTQKALGVLNLVSQGMSNEEIGNKLFTSKRTVEGVRSVMLIKTGTRNTIGTSCGNRNSVCLYGF